MEEIAEAFVTLRPDFANFGRDTEKGLGSSLGGVMKGLGAAAGAALAAGVAVAFGTALEREAGSDKLAARMGLSPKQSQQMGAVAGRLYADAYGDSMGEVNTALEAVKTSFRGLTRTSEADLERLTAKALDYATAFDMDVAQAVATAGIVMESGLAKDADEAFDLIVASSQKVPAAVRQDVLDAADEYSQFFSALGFDGEEAFGVLVKASERGMYGIDKAGDAIKEFTIRSTDMSTLSKAAYETLGLDAEKMADRIVRGGESARDATEQIITGLLNIKDPAERANTAIALFGTPLEDLNVTQIPQFLEGLGGVDTKLGDVEGSARKMGDTLNDNTKTKFTAWKRSVETNVVNFIVEQVIPALDDLSDWWRRNEDDMVDAGQAIAIAWHGNTESISRDSGDMATAVGTATDIINAALNGSVAAGRAYNEGVRTFTLQVQGWFADLAITILESMQSAMSWIPGMEEQFDRSLRKVRGFRENVNEQIDAIRDEKEFRIKVENQTWEQTVARLKTFHQLLEGLPAELRVSPNAGAIRDDLLQGIGNGGGGAPADGGSRDFDGGGSVVAAGVNIHGGLHITTPRPAEDIPHALRRAAMAVS